MRSFGYDTSVMVRSILLRGFDQVMANKIGQCLSKIGVKFIRQSIPVSYHKTNNNLRCHYCGYARAKYNKCDKC